MSDWLASLLAALIGAGIGSIGAVLITEWRKEKAEARQRRELLVQRYLFQLQDALETLWFRVRNLAHQQGRSVMDEQYFETTTLYALGRALALERLLALDGIYPELDRLYPGLGTFLLKHRVDTALADGAFYQYDRLALAEAVMEREGERFRASTYLEFRRRYEGNQSGDRELLAPAREAVESLERVEAERLLALLRQVATEIAEVADIPSGLPDAEAKSLPAGATFR